MPTMSACFNVVSLNGSSSLRVISVTNCARLEVMETILRRRLENGNFGSVPEKRTRTMRAVRGKGNKTTEVRLRMALVREGVSGWVMHRRELPGTPDFLFPNQKLAVFVDGCFWHGCPKCGHIPKNNRAFWKAKIRRNQQRDHQTEKMLRRIGIEIVRIWEHSLKSGSIERAVTRINGIVDGSKPKAVHSRWS
jgi:DNA mismatch endonuclease (patch repair protein)